MPTASNLALITDKKLLGFRDLNEYLLKYLQAYVRNAVKRLFIQGAFQEQLPIAGVAANTIEVGLKPTLLDGFAHDGAGNLLNLEEIDRAATFANTVGQVYEVGASYVEYPVGFRRNPRTGKAEYDHMREGIGVEANPSSVSANLASITFVVDSLFEQGVTVADHTGRSVRVFRLVPGDLATDESNMIEVCTVFYDGQNKITTTSLLGQSTPDSSPSLYIVQLVGLTVLMDTATNAPSQLPESTFFIGTVTGNGSTPAAFDITGQQVIEAQSAGFVSTDPLPNWYDGTVNNETTVQAALEKILSDLVISDGAPKISAAALPDWLDTTSNPVGSIQDQLDKIVGDLSDAGGGGAAKVSAAALADWADATTNPLGSVQSLLANIVDSLISTTGARGAGKITAPALPDWADGTTNPPARLDEALAKIVDDLTTGYGSLKITSPALGGDPYDFPDGQVALQLVSAQVGLNETAVYNERRAEFEAIRGIKPVYQESGGGTIYDIAAEHVGDDPNDLIESMLAVGGSSVGSVSTLVRFTPGQQWTSLAAASGYNKEFRAVTHGHLGYAMVGDDGELQTYASGSVVRRLTGGDAFYDIAYMPGSPGIYCAVGHNGKIYTNSSPSDFAAWSVQAAAAGMTADSFGAIETDGNLFVVTTRSGSKIMTSPDGVTWTQQPDGTLGSTSYLARQLAYSPRFGFVQLRLTTGGSLGVSYSEDGITWVHQGAKSGTVVVESSFIVALLDRQVAYFHSNGALFSAIVAETTQQTPMPTQVSGHQEIFHVADAIPVCAKNIKGTLYMGGSNATGAVILASAPFRPNTTYGV